MVKACRDDKPNTLHLCNSASAISVHRMQEGARVGAFLRALTRAPSDRHLVNAVRSRIDGSVDFLKRLVRRVPGYRDN